MFQDLLNDGFFLDKGDDAHFTAAFRTQGVKNIYFAIVSSFFKGDYDDLIRAIKIETEIREILFIEAVALVTLLEQKLRDSNLDLGPKGIQSIFAQSGVITNNDMKEFLGIG